MKLTPTEVVALINEIESMRDDLTQAEEKLLRSQGWEYKTSPIDCCWYWYKAIDGVLHAADSHIALRWAIREFQDSHQELYDEVN
jgi:hypothetical protein